MRKTLYLLIAIAISSPFHSFAQESVCDKGIKDPAVIISANNSGCMEATNKTPQGMRRKMHLHIPASTAIAGWQPVLKRKVILRLYAVTCKQ